MNTFANWVDALPAHQAALLGACIAALFGAIANILTGVLRDFCAKAWTDRRDAQRTSNEIFRRYAEPLGSATTSLYWRLKEVIGEDGRASFLMAAAPRSEFDEYKLRSTYFRLAAVLGWLRALRRELSFLRNNGDKRVGAIESGISAFERSLADGHHVELQRLHGLLNLWGLPSIPDKTLELRVAIAVEHCVKQVTREAGVLSATELDTTTKEILCEKASATITAKAAFRKIEPAVLAETQSRAIRQIAIRKAWLYRDWQASIGDLMIRDAKVGNRNFEVLGYGDFEEMMLNPTATQKRSLCRIEALFDRLEMDHEDPYDARPAVIRKLFEALAMTIVALGDTPASRAAIDPHTAEDARHFVSKRRPLV